MKVILETERLLLREFVEDDAEAFLAFNGDPRVMQHTGEPVWTELEETRKSFREYPDVWHAITGRPWILRLMGGGFSKPKNPVPGIDVAGVVESAGPSVRRFKPGDEVFGHTRTVLQWKNGGTFAEYVAVPEDALALKPANIGFAEAGSVPTSGFIALFNLRGGGRSRLGTGTVSR